MQFLTDSEFLKVLFASQTFITTIIEASYFFVGCGLVVALVVRHYLSISKMAALARVRGVHQNSSGAAGAVDFVLVVPLFMFIMCVFVQMAMIVNASLIVHYSAFSAARSARAHYCDRSVLTYGLGFAKCSIRDAQEEAEKAARFVLIAASPVDGTVSANGSPPEDVINWLSDQYIGRSTPILTQARYAFDSRNVDVRVEPARSNDPAIRLQHDIEKVPPSLSLGEINDLKLRNTWPISVTVTYTKHLGVPLVGPFISDEQRGNDHFRDIEAKVTLL